MGRFIYQTHPEQAVTRNPAGGAAQPRIRGPRKGVTSPRSMAKPVSSMPQAYYIVEAEKATGPHSLVVLKQKAEIHVLSPDSLVHPSEAPAGTAWTPIRELPALHELLFPTRTRPTLGTTTFESANTQTESTTKAFSIEAALHENTARQRLAEGSLLKDIGPRPNNRRRDFFVCTIALNLFVAGVGQFIGYANPFLVGLWALGNLGVVWLLYGVMDRY